MVGARMCRAGVVVGGVGVVYKKKPHPKTHRVGFVVGAVPPSQICPVGYPLRVVELEGDVQAPRCSGGRKIEAGQQFGVKKTRRTTEGQGRFVRRLDDAG